MQNRRQLYKMLSTERWKDSSVFFLRIFVGVMMLIHGIAKINGYEMLFTSFPDPLGIGTAGYRKVPFRNSQLLVSAFASTDRAAADSCRRVLSRRNGELWVYEQR